MKKSKKQDFYYEKNNKLIYQYGFFKVIRYIFFQPNKKFSVRGLARQINISHSSAGEYLKNLKKKDMLTHEQIGNTYQYKINQNHPLVKEWKRILFLEELFNAKTVEEINNILGKDKVEAILLYGSMAKGTADEKSDIDILVISKSTKKMNTLNLEGKLYRETNITVLSPFEWKQKAKKQKPFYEDVILNSIVLYGEKPVVL